VSKRKRQRLTLADWSSIPTTTPQNKSGWESRQEFYERERREEEARRNAPILAAQAEVNRNLAALQKHTKKFWSQPVAAITEGMKTGDESAFDPALSVPEGPCTREATQKSFATWLEQLPSTPYTLSEDGQVRMILYGMYAVAKGGHDFGNVEAWDSAFQRLLQLEVFASGELSYDPTQVASEPEITTLSEREQIERDMWAEMYPLAKEWADSLRRNFGYEITKADREMIFGTDSKSAIPAKRGLFFVLNLNPLAHKSYDTIRKYLCDRMIWNPERLLTEDDKFQRAIEAETTPLSRMSGQSRQTLVSSLNLLRK